MDSFEIIFTPADVNTINKVYSHRSRTEIEDDSAGATNTHGNAGRETNALHSRKYYFIPTL